MIDTDLAVLLQHIQAMEILTRVANADILNSSLDDRTRRLLYRQLCTFRTYASDFFYLKSTLEQEAIFLATVEHDMEAD